MNIVIFHAISDHTTGNYFQKSLEKFHHVNYLAEHLDFLSHNFIGLPIQQVVDENLNLLLYIDPVTYTFPHGLEKLTCPTAIYLIDVHQNLEQRLALAYFFDYVFIAQKDYLPLFKERGIRNVFWLPLACDPEVHYQIASSKEKLYEIGFVGNRGFIGSERRDLLDELEQTFRMNDLNQRYSPEEIRTIYSQSQIVFNYSINGDLNMRVFEALCSGRMLLTNAIPNGLEEVFTDRKHLVIYRNFEELVELAHYYLKHTDEREAIATAGQAEVLTKHTYQHRTEQILTTIFSNGKPQLVAPVRTWLAKKRWQAYTQVLSDMRQPQGVWKLNCQAWREGDASWRLITALIKAVLRAFNQHTPLTPNALRYRWKFMRSKS